MTLDTGEPVAAQGLVLSQLLYTRSIMPAKKRKHVLIAAASLIFGAIAGWVGALATWPFWGWFEKTTGIESLGHSGPDDWVFNFMIGLAVVAIFALLEFTFRERSASVVPRSGE